MIKYGLQQRILKENNYWSNFKKQFSFCKFLLEQSR